MTPMERQQRRFCCASFVPIILQQSHMRPLDSLRPNLLLVFLLFDNSGQRSSKQAPDFIFWSPVRPFVSTPQPTVNTKGLLNRFISVKKSADIFFVVLIKNAWISSVPPPCGRSVNETLMDRLNRLRRPAAPALSERLLCVSMRWLVKRVEDRCCAPPEKCRRAGRVWGRGSEEGNGVTLCTVVQRCSSGSPHCAEGLPTGWELMGLALHTLFPRPHWSAHHLGSQFLAGEGSWGPCWGGFLGAAGWESLRSLRV